MREQGTESLDSTEDELEDLFIGNSDSVCRELLRKSLLLLEDCTIKGASAGDFADAVNMVKMVHNELNGRIVTKEKVEKCQKQSALE